jgi:hypothetical protein
VFGFLCFRFVLEYGIPNTIYSGTQQHARNGGRGSGHVCGLVRDWMNDAPITPQRAIMGLRYHWLRYDCWLRPVFCTVVAPSHDRFA